MDNHCCYLLSRKLANAASQQELDELDALLLRHPEWQYAIQHIVNIWDAQSQQPAEEAAYNQHLKRMERLGHDMSQLADEIAPGRDVVAESRRFVKSKLLWGVGIAACFSLVIAAWAFLKAGRIKQPAIAARHQQVSTVSGDRKLITLPDGTRVWINSESKIDYDEAYGKLNRAITLTGEAYFDVVKNTELPFVIHTKNIQIKVTGTAFNVKAYPSDLMSETSLIRGRVEVTVNARPDEKYVLKPNEKLLVRDLSQPQETSKTKNTAGKTGTEPLIQLGYINFLENDSAALETSWVYNRLIFDNKSFEEIATDLERWYGVHITIQSRSVANQRMTYTIKNETIAEALHNMQYALHFNYRINGKDIVITN